MNKMRMGTFPETSPNNKVAILGYHEITPEKSPKRYAITSELFRGQLAWLKGNGYKTTSLTDICEALIQKNGLPEKNIVLTFDDGLLNHYEIAFPMLKEFGFTATFFVIAGSVGKDGYLTFPHLKELLAAGMTIGSHGFSHGLLTLLPQEKIIEEFRASKEILERALLSPIQFLSIPRGQDNEKIREIAKNSGYRVICISRAGYIDIKSDACALNRLFLRNYNTLSDFKKIVRGDKFIRIQMYIKELVFGLLRNILGMKLYEKMRMMILKSDYV